MNKEAKPEKYDRLSEGMKVALISAIASIVAALIGGVFVLYSTFATSHSQSVPIFITSQPQSTSVPTFATTHVPSTPILNSNVTPTPILSSNITSTPILSGKVTSTPTSPSNTSALSVYPTSVAFSSCSSKDNRTFAFNVTNSSNAPISWTISSGSAYSYSLLAQNSGQITQGSPTTGGNIPAQQTQAVFVGNITANTIFIVQDMTHNTPLPISITCS